MANTFTSNVFSSTYKDDYRDSDNYYRILFNSGRALQARELTQMQTIIQEEIGRFGRNIFKDGASVNPGGPTITNDYEFVKLNTSINTLPTTPNDLVGVELTGGTSTVKARVLQVVEATGSDPATIYVQYTNTSGGAVGANPVRFVAGENLTGGGETLTVQSTNTVANPAFGRGAKIANGAGDFFTRGHFVFVPSQELILSKYTQNPTAVVGFKVTEDIVTTSDTNALYDNQGATPNLSSPGADRYRITLTLTTQDLIDSDENFVFFCNVVDGEIVDQVTGTDDYNKINDLLAERTKEESGNYIAKSFEADLSDSGDNLIVTVSDGVAYVNGYRAETESPTKLSIPKPRSTVINTNEVVGINYGQFFVCDVLKGSLNVSQFQTVNLRSATAHGGSTIGTARVRYVEEDGANFRVYLFDIAMNSGQVLRNVKSVGTSTTDYADILLENSKAVIKESTKINMVFATPNPRPKDITDDDFEVQRIRTGTSNGAGSLTLSLATTGETFVNTSQWIVTTDSSGDVVASPSISGAGTNSVTITGLPTSSAVTIYSKVNKAQPSVRQKTLVETTFSGGVESDGLGTKYVDLHATDIYDVLSIKQTDSDGADLTSRFTVDNGQRAGYYANGRLVLDGGATAPTGSVFTRFKHFTHGAGDYFSVNSYTGQVNYEDIPSFQIGPRTSVNLRDVIDFRSSVDSDGLFTGSGAALNEVPTNGDIFQADIEYYLPRADKIVVTTQGVVKNIQGENGFASQIPSTPENTLALFEIEHNAYGLNDSDVVITPVEAKRFTMNDISKLEKRIDKLEEVTALSLLEVDTSALLVLDSAGNPRTKSGFFVDNFADRSFADAQNSEYRAAIDPSRGILQPQTIEENVTLRYDSAASSNTILKGDTVFLNYTHKEAITQTKVSGVENVNPFAVITGEGNITLSPASDEWQQTKYIPANVINRTATEQLSDINEGNLALGTARQRGFNQWAWSGLNFSPILGFGFGGLFNIFNGWAGVGLWNWSGIRTNNEITLNSTQRSGRNITRRYSQRIVVGNRTVRKVVGDKSVSLTFLPFIRSRKVFFRAEGLRPNTRYFPFFDGVSVSDFVREESFDRFSTSANGGAKYGNAYRNSTSHPEGSSELISDQNGKIAGSFFIPSNTTTRFRAGTREFKLLDISKNDDTASLSRASINYVAQGTLDTRQKTVTSTRITQVRTRRWTETERVRNRDPLAQSFRVTEPNGMFVTKVQTYFKSKDDTIPIELQIRPMVNGAPSSTEIIGNAIKFLNNPTSEVALPSSQTAAAVVAAPTTFEFDEPIFLNPDTEYCIVLLAESVNYEAYVGETYAFELGSTEKRISRQPSMGSLFKSQNGTTWEPDQTKDLAFKIFKAEFDTAGGYAVFENVDLEDELLENNPFYVDSGDATITTLIPNHGFDVGDTITISGLDSATVYNGILGTSILGSRTVTAIDGFGLRFEADSSSTSAGRFGGTDVTTDRQVQFNIAVPNFTTLIPDDTNLSYSAKFTSGKSLAAITGEQVRYQKDGTYSSDIVIGDENIFSTPRLIAKSSNETSELGAGVRSTTFKVDMTTIRADVSPIIDAQRTSLTTVSNLIDNQAASPASGFNVPLTYTEETTSFGGSALCKHMTTVSVLEEAAVGLKVIVSAIRPSGSDFDLYFRTANDGENIFDTDWTLQVPETTVAPDGSNFREYRYLIGGQGGSIPEFTQYQYKIVMRSNNSSAVPVFKDFRSIAMAV